MSLLLTRTNNYRAVSQIDRHEIRNTEAGAFTAMWQDGFRPGGIVSQDFRDKAMIATGNTLEIPVVDLDNTVTIGAVALATIADSELNSAMLPVTFIRYAWGFTQTPAAHMNNEVSLQEDFNKKFQMYLRKFIETVEAAAVTALDNAKTQVFGDLLGGKFTNVANVAVSALAQEQFLLGNMSPLMRANDFQGSGLQIVGNPSFESSFRTNVLNRGEFQSTNEGFQYSDKNMFFSNAISNAADQMSTIFAFVPGSTGIVVRPEREVGLAVQQGRDVTTLRGHVFAMDTLPVLNIPVGTYFYDNVEDRSAIVGAATADLTRGRVHAYGWCVDVAYPVAYISDRATLASPIIKASVSTT